MTVVREPATQATRPASQDAPLAIETHKLRKVYGDLVAVDGLDLSVEQGEVFGFLGPNGAGKSTVVKMLTSLARPTSGSARLLDRPLGDKDARRKLGYLPEMFRFHDWLTANEFLDMHGRLYGMAKPDRHARIPEVLSLVGLDGRGDDRLRTFSKGMQQRAGLAQALIHQPQIIFLDEPTSALDPIGRRIVRDVIRDLRDAGATVFLNSHLLSEVEMVCDRVAIMNRGKVVAIGRLDELARKELAVSMRLGNWSNGHREIVEQAGEIESLETDTAGVALLTVLLPDEHAVSCLIDDLVRAGASVYSVVPARQTLEDLFVDFVDQSDGMDLSAGPRQDLGR